MRMVQLTKQEKENILENLLKRSPNQYDEYQEAVNEILENVKKEGDKAPVQVHTHVSMSARILLQSAQELPTLNPH